MVVMERSEQQAVYKKRAVSSQVSAVLAAIIPMMKWFPQRNLLSPFVFSRSDESLCTLCFSSDMEILCLNTEPVEQSYQLSEAFYSDFAPCLLLALRKGTVPVPPHRRLSFCEKAPATEGLTTPARA